MELYEIKRDPKPGYIVLIVITLLAFIAQVIFNAIQNDVFTDTDLELDIEPAGWAFSIWGLIYVAEFGIILYGLTLACRYNPRGTGGQLYYDPPFLPPTFWAILSISCIFNAGWLYIIEEEYLWASSITLLSLWLSIQICLIFAIRLMWRYESELTRSEIWINVLLVQNGLGLYQTWTVIATVLNIGFLLNDFYDVSMSDTCWIALSVIGTVYIINFIYDMLMGFRYRYQLTPYLVYVWAFAGIVEKNYDADDDFQVFAAVLLGFFILGLLVKVIVTIISAIRNPTVLEQEREC